MEKNSAEGCDECGKKRQTALQHFALNLLLNPIQAQSDGLIKRMNLINLSMNNVPKPTLACAVLPPLPVCLPQLSGHLPHLVAGTTHSDHFVRLHGVHTIRHHLVAVRSCGGDNASVACHFLQLKPEGAQCRHSPQCPPQLGFSSALTSQTTKHLKMNELKKGDLRLSG